MSKRIKFAKVSFVSLCKRGANRIPGLYKSDDDSVVFESLAKLDDEGVLTSLVYVSESEDGQGHSCSKAAVEGMAHSFMSEGAQLDMNHDRRPISKDKAFVVESFIVQAGDLRFADAKDAEGNSLNTEGAWCIKTKLNDPELRKLYREDGWDGVSLYSYPGDYEFEGTPADASISKAEAAAQEVVDRKQEKESEMDKAELQEVLAKLLEPVTSRLDSLEKVDPPKAPVDPPTEDTTETELEMPDPTDRPAMAKYRKALVAKERKEKALALAEDHDLTTVQGCTDYEADLAKLDEELTEKPTRNSLGMGKNQQQPALANGQVSDEYSKFLNKSLAKNNLLAAAFKE